MISAFENTLKTNDWMDQETKDEGLLKLSKMEQVIAYPDEVLEEEKMNKLHENLMIGKKNFQNAKCAN